MLPSRKTKLNSGKLKVDVEDHLRFLKQEFEGYFPDLSDIKLPKLKMTRNFFRLNNNIFFKDLQEEFLEMKCNSIAKNNFKAMSLTDFREKYVHIYKIVGAVSIRTLLPFSSTYMSENSFSS